MKQDLFFVLMWWAYILFLGCLFLPITRLFWDRFFDKGYLFSKAVGILGASYLVWLLSSLHLFPFTRPSILISLGVLYYVIFIYFKGWGHFKLLVKNHKTIFLVEEGVFLAGLLAWSFIRGLQPDIFGLEKFTDFGFINSLLLAEYMPPLDAWFAGETLNYYYWGQYYTAYLIKLTHVPPEIGYNIMVATLFSLTFGLGFSLTANFIYWMGKERIKRVVFGGLLSAALLTVGGNLHTLVWAYIMPWARKVGLYDHAVKSYWYPDATRYIGHNPPTDDKTIHEFPMYSFVVSDLHAHVMDIPVVLTIVAVLFLFFTQTADAAKKVLYFRPSRWIVLLAFLISLTLMTNTWDYPIYWGLAGIIILVRRFQTSPTKQKALLATLVEVAQLSVLSLLFALPFTLQFEAFAKGVGIVESHSPLYQLLILWGYQLFFVLVFVFSLYLLAKSYIANHRDKGLRQGLWQFFATLHPAQVFILIMGVYAIGLLIVPEIIHIKDIYSKGHSRSNTMFKFTYQAFILFALSVGYIFVIAKEIIRRHAPQSHRTYVLISVLMVAMPLLYPYWAIVKGYYGPIKLERYRGLNGIAFLEKRHPDNYQALNWLRNNVQGQPVVLEANGDSFTIANHFSAFTGFPTILGWFVHEWLYRGDAAIPNGRIAEIKTVYESDDMEATRRILNKYNVQYIIVGQLEQEKFKPVNINKLYQMGRVVFSAPDAKIIKIE